MARQPLCLMEVTMVASKIRWLSLVLVFFLLGATDSDQSASTNAALQSYPTMQFHSITRLGFFLAGDGGSAVYFPSDSACSLNGGNGDNGSEVKSIDGKCWLAKLEPAASVKIWGAAVNGTTDDSAALSACVAATASNGTACLLPKGTLIADNVALVNNGNLTGVSAAASVIRRKPNSLSTGFLVCSTCSSVRLSTFTLDGNKANETVGANNITFTGYQDVHIVGVSSLNSKGGQGISFDASRDQSAGMYSEVTNVVASSNDGSGILVYPIAWGFRSSNVVANSNGVAGLAIGDFARTSGTSIADTLQGIRVTGGEYNNNGDVGLWIVGYITGYVDGQPVFGSGIEPVSDIIVRGPLTANENGTYGVALQARQAMLVDATVSRNARLVNWGAGGFLVNCEQCELVNLTSFANNVYNTGYGADAGCGLGVHFRGGHFENNTIGINIGCSQFSDIRDATIANNSVDAISAFSGEASGDGYGITGYTRTLVIDNNRIGCPSSGAPTGIYSNGGAFGIQISRNFIQGCDLNRAIISDALSADIRDNIVINPAATGDKWIGGSDVTINAASGTLVIPDWVHTITLTGSNNLSSIKRASTNAIGTGIASFYISAPGSNYPQHPTVTVSGCTTPPVFLQTYSNRGGQFTGVQFTSRGSGCVNPTATVSGGSGAVTTLYTGASVLAGMHQEITLIVGAGGSLTFSGGGNIVSGGALSAAGPNTVVRLLDNLGSMTEISRVIH